MLAAPTRIAFVAAAVGLLSTLLPVAASAQRHRPEDPATVEARHHFETGAALFQAHNYDGALAEFEESYRIRPVPVVLFNIAQTLKLLERYQDAIDAYQRYLGEDHDIDAARRAAVQQTIDELRAALGPVTILVDEDGAEVRVDGRVVGVSPITESLSLAAGTRRFEAELDGRRATAQVEVVGGRPATVRIVIPDPPRLRTSDGETPITSRWWFWTAAVLAVAAGVVVVAVVASPSDQDAVPGTLGTVAALRW